MVNLGPSLFPAIPWGGWWFSPPGWTLMHVFITPVASRVLPVNQEYLRAEQAPQAEPVLHLVSRIVPRFPPRCQW